MFNSENSILRTFSFNSEEFSRSILRTWKFQNLIVLRIERENYSELNGKVLRIVFLELN